jgi:TRAP-type mannitol/chloroaromatic compound transport system permease small subunit
VYRSGEGSGLSAWNPKIWPYRVVYVAGFALFALQSFAKLLENLLVVVGHAPKDTRS